MTSSPSPSPPLTQPPSSAATAAQSSRSTRRNELEALRQKGLTKIFNKHFTTAAERIEQDKKEAELALADISRRKADMALNPKLYEMDGISLSQLEKLSMELQKRKQRLYRKEMETWELYKRYESQYRRSPKVSRDDDMEEEEEEELLVVDDNILPESFNNIKDEQDRQDEDATMEDTRTPIRDNLQWKQYNSDDITSTGFLTPSSHIPNDDDDNDDDDDDFSLDFKDDRTNNDNVPDDRNNEDNEDNDDDEKDIEQSTGSLPDLSKISYPDSISHTESFSIQGVPSNESNIIIASSPNDDDDDTKEEDTIKDDSQSVAIMSVDSTESSLREYPAPSTSDGDDATFISAMMGLNYTQLNDDDDDDDDLATIDGATVAEAEERLTDFLRTEGEKIKKVMGAASSSSSTSSDTSSTVSSLGETIYSTAITMIDNKEITETVVEMTRKMEEATAWLKEDDTMSATPNTNEDEEASVYRIKTDWRAYWSMPHQREYYHNVKTNQTCWSKPKGVKIDTSHVDKLEIDGQSNKDEYKDSAVVVKDFTKKGPKEESSYSFGTKGSLSSILKSSKVLEYRRRVKLQSKKRRRKMFAFICLIIAILMVVKFSNVPGVIMHSIHSSPKVETILDKLPKRRTRKEARRQRRVLKEERIRERKEIISMKTQERLARREEKQRQNAEVKLNRQVRRQEEKERREKERTLRGETAIKTKAREWDRLEGLLTEQEPWNEWVKQEETNGNTSRPLKCYIPLSYVVSSKCNILAEFYPMFDLQELTDSMME